MKVHIRIFDPLVFSKNIMKVIVTLIFVFLAVAVNSQYYGGNMYGGMPYGGSYGGGMGMPYGGNPG